MTDVNDIGQAGECEQARTELGGVDGQVIAFPGFIPSRRDTLTALQLPPVQ